MSLITVTYCDYTMQMQCFKYIAPHCVIHVAFCYLVVANFVVLCETYSKQKKKLAKAEHKEILEYARSRYLVYTVFTWLNTAP